MSIKSHRVTAISTNIEQVNEEYKAKIENGTFDNDLNLWVAYRIEPPCELSVMATRLITQDTDDMAKLDYFGSKVGEWSMYVLSVASANAISEHQQPTIEPTTPARLQEIKEDVSYKLSEIVNALSIGDTRDIVDIASKSQS